MKLAMPCISKLVMPIICFMKTSEAIKHFGSASALARALGIKPPSVAGWGEDVPDLRQLQLEALTGGVLRADDRLKIVQQQAAA